MLEGRYRLRFAMVLQFLPFLKKIKENKNKNEKKKNISYIEFMKIQNALSTLNFCISCIFIWEFPTRVRRITGIDACYDMYLHDIGTFAQAK